MKPGNYSVYVVMSLMVCACSQKPPAVDNTATAALVPSLASEHTARRMSPAVSRVGESVDGLSTAGRMITTGGSPTGPSVYSEPCLITETSIAGIESPETLGEFANAFPAGSMLVFEPYYMVDLGSLCLIEGGHEKICTWFFVYDTETWDPEVEATGLFTSSPGCETHEGVRPGSTVSDVATTYGRPQFQFNYDNEGREYVQFAAAPETLSFRASSRSGEDLASDAASQPHTDVFWPNGQFGGDYSASGADSMGAYETELALPDAVIDTVIVR